MARRVRSRTVRFFEVVDRKTAHPFEHDLPWSRTLEALSSSDLEPKDRTVVIGGEDHHGGAWQLSGYPDMLLLSAIRDDAELPELFDRARGTLESLEIAESQGVAETSHVGFFPSNIVGMIRTNTTPGAGSLERWINGMELWDNVDKVTVLPLSRVSVTQRVEDVERALGVKVRMRSTAAQSLAGQAPRLADTVEHLRQHFGPVMVEMRIYIPRDQGYVEESETIMEEARGLLALTSDGQGIEGVDAAELHFRSRERERRDDINILKDKLAETVEVEVLDDEGRATKRASAARAMQHAYNRLERDLQAAINRDRG